MLPTGIEAVSQFASEHGTEDQLEMPEFADGILGVMCDQLNGLDARVDGLSKLIEQHAWLDTDARRQLQSHPKTGRAHDCTDRPSQSQKTLAMQEVSSQAIVIGSGAAAQHSQSAHLNLMRIFANRND